MDFGLLSTTAKFQNAEGQTRKQLEFMNDFGAVYHIRYVPNNRDFNPKKVVAVVIHALLVTRRHVDLFLLRLRRFLHRVKVLQRWFRHCLQRRELSFDKVLERWNRLEEIQRKSIKMRIYSIYCKVRKDAARGMIETYVSKLNVSTDHKKLAIRCLYWEKSAQFRAEFRKWLMPYKEVRAEVADVAARCRSIFDPAVVKALEEKLAMLQEKLLHQQRACPLFRFDGSSVKLSDLVDAVALVPDAFPARLPSSEMSAEGASEEATAPLPRLPSSSPKLKPLREAHSSAFGSPGCTEDPRPRAEASPKPPLCVASPPSSPGSKVRRSVSAEQGNSEAQRAGSPHPLESIALPPTIEDYDDPARRDMCLQSCLSRKLWQLGFQGTRRESPAAPRMLSPLEAAEGLPSRAKTVVFSEPSSPSSWLPAVRPQEAVGGRKEAPLGCRSPTPSSPNGLLPRLSSLRLSSLRANSP
eukprot:RCo052885